MALWATGRAGLLVLEPKVFRAQGSVGSIGLRAQGFLRFRLARSRGFRA